MPRAVLEFLAELAWSMWAWPALEGAGEWPFVLVALLCDMGGLALGVGLAWAHAGQLARGPRPAGALAATGWVLGRAALTGFGAALALFAAFGALCLARVVVISGFGAG